MTLNRSKEGECLMDPSGAAVPLIVLVIGSFGLVIGSFLNVVICRVPRGESIAYPPSHCPNCGHRLTAVELIPVFSYLIQGGRCRNCNAPISWQYPVVEILTAVLLILVYQTFGYTGTALYYAALACILIVAAFTDLNHQIIPDKVILAGLVIGAALELAFRPRPPADNLYGLLLAGGLLLAASAVTLGGMGGGDVKLAALLGFYLGWRGALLALFLGFVAGAAAGLCLILLKIRGRKDFIPFGPFLALGGMVATLWGPRIIEWYIAYALGR